MSKALERGAGILLPISSLPSPYGIGTMGRDAYDFVDMLKRAGQKYWQVLPIGPTSFGDSPYQSFSAFAGNPYFIDLDTLIAEGLIKKEEVESYKWLTVMTRSTTPEYTDRDLKFSEKHLADQSTKTAGIT